MDDFQFKPITDGLGFHNKKKNLKNELAGANIVKDEITLRVPNDPGRNKGDTLKRRTYEELLKSLETSDMPQTESAGPQIIEPIPNIQPPAKPPEIDEGHAPDLTGDLFKPKLKLQIETGVRRGGADSPVSPLEKSNFCFPAIALDGVVVIALSLLFIVSLLVVTKLDFVSVLLSTQSDYFAQLSFLVLFMSVIEMYVIVSRSFFGRTLGEWTFDHQVGEDNEQKRAFYPLRVVYRSFLVLITGFVLLPFLSLVTGKDLAGKMSGLQLYKLRGA